MSHHSRIALACWLAIALLFTLPTSAQERVTLHLKWKHQFQFAGYYAAKAKGFYEEAGFDVKIEARDNASNAFEKVKLGQATFGIADSSIVLKRMQGDPLVVLSTVFQHNGLMLMTLAESGLRSPYDLIGRNVMYQKGIDGAAITAMFTVLGITEDQYQYFEHNFNELALMSDNIDAMSAYSSNQPLEYASRGVETVLIDPANYGIDFYGDLLFTRQDYVENYPERAVAFTQASLRGWEYALRHPTEIAQLIIDQYDPEESLELLLQEAQITRQLINAEVVPIGTTLESRFSRIAAIYHDLNMVDRNSGFDGLLLSDYVVQEKNLLSTELLVGGAVVGLLVMLAILSLYGFNQRLQKEVTTKTRDLLRSNRAIKSALQLQEQKSHDLLRAKLDTDSAYRAKGKFLSNISVALNSPLSGISGALQLLRKKVTDDEDKILIEQALIATRSLASTMSDVIDCAAIESGKISFDVREFHLHEVAQAVHDEFSVKATKKALTFELSIEDEVPKTCIGDPIRTKQIIRNLVSNAIKFTNGGYVKVSVCRSGQQLTLRVEDSGVGLPPDVLERLNKPFDRDQHIITPDFTGVHLGLIITRSLVYLGGGSIEAISHPNSGTTIQVNLPIIIPKAD